MRSAHYNPVIRDALVLVLRAQDLTRRAQEASARLSEFAKRFDETAELARKRQRP